MKPKICHSLFFGYYGVELNKNGIKGGSVFNKVLLDCSKIIVWHDGFVEIGCKIFSQYDQPVDHPGKTFYRILMDYCES